MVGWFSSAPHSLLATGRVDAAHPDLATDPLGILHPASKLCHSLPLVSILKLFFASSGYCDKQMQSLCIEIGGYLQVSAGSSFGRMNGLGPTLDRQRQHMDPNSNEPLFTNCTRDFLGTLDYIFYTGQNLLFSLCYTSWTIH
jgi:CCR4-NOT transcription complex subunit 6